MFDSSTCDLNCHHRTERSWRDPRPVRESRGRVYWDTSKNKKTDEQQQQHKQQDQIYSHSALNKRWGSRSGQPITASRNKRNIYIVYINIEEYMYTFFSPNFVSRTTGTWLDLYNERARARIKAINRRFPEEIRNPVLFHTRCNRCILCIWQNNMLRVVIFLRNRKTHHNISFHVNFRFGLHIYLQYVHYIQQGDSARKVAAP